MSTRFGQDFEVEVPARFEAVDVMKLNLGQDSKVRSGQNFEADVL